MLKYEGLFFDNETINKLLSRDFNKLQIVNRDLHVTMREFPKEENKELIGKKYQIKVIGYGTNKQNSGFLIELPHNLLPYYKNLDKDGSIIKPHITTSMSLGASAKNTKNLEFKLLENPFYVEAFYSNNERQEQLKLKK